MPSPRKHSPHGFENVKRGQALVLVGVVVVVAALLALQAQQGFDLAFVQEQRFAALAFVEANPVLAPAAFLLLYIAVTGLSLPGAALLTLIAGAAFGLVLGTVLVSFASSIGATVAFVLARYLFRDVVQRRFAAPLARINEGIAKDGAFYLFALRLVPAFPFFAINLGMALTPLKVTTFYWVSQVGMLAGTVVYVNAGREIGKLESLSGILSPTLIASFALLGLFPLIARKALDTIKRRRER